MQFLRDLEEELHTVQFEEENLKRRLDSKSSYKVVVANGHQNGSHGNGIADLQERLAEVLQDKIEIGTCTLLISFLIKGVTTYVFPFNKISTRPMCMQ